MDFDSIINKITDTAGVVAQKVESTVDLTKQKYNIAKKNKELDLLYLDLGKLFYTNKEDLAGSSEEILSLCNAISEKKAEISELEGKIKEGENKKTCPECKKTVGEGDEFCSHCGKKL